VPYLPHTTPDHDETLIARLAADDVPETDRDGRRARQLVAECPACAELLADLRAIVAATADLPAPPRTRDFRLTEADAARLRPAGWRGLLARLGSPGFAFTRPLAAGLTTLGIAGLLLATLPGAGLGGAATSLAPERVLSTVGKSVGSEYQGGSQDSSGAGPTAGPSAAPAPAVVGPEASSPDRAAPSAPPTGVPSTTGPAVAANGSPEAAATPGQAAGPSPLDEQEGGGTGWPSPLAVASIALLVAGVALGALRLIARRLA
jgi:hypothetical protein